MDREVCTVIFITVQTALPNTDILRWADVINISESHLLLMCDRDLIHHLLFEHVYMLPKFIRPNIRSHACLSKLAETCNLKTLHCRLLLGLTSNLLAAGQFSCKQRSLSRDRRFASVCAEIALMAASVPVTLVAGVTSDKALEVPYDNILPKVLNFLPWNDPGPAPPPGAPPPGALPPPPRSLPQWAAFDAFGGPFTFNLVGPANHAQWIKIHPMVFSLNSAFWTRVLSALVDAGLCAKALTEEELEDAVMQAANAISPPAAGSAHCLQVTAVDLDPSPQSLFLRPAVPGRFAVPAVPAVFPGAGRGRDRGIPRGRPAVPRL